MTIIPGQYYVCIEKDGPIEVGDLILVTNVSAHQVNFVVGSRGFYSDMNEFVNRYEHDPEGEKKRELQITELMREISDFSSEQRAIEASMAGISISTTDLVKSSDVAATKKRLGMAKGQIVKMKEAALARSEKLEGYLEEKKSLLMAKVDGMQTLVKQLEEVVWAINLYAGSEEQIVRLRKGEPAPATEKVAIRQLVLFMDEECALHPEKGGVGAKEMEDFDDWISDKKHPERLRQVLPEPRGVVAMIIRRNEKYYSDDPWTQGSLSQNDKKTYFLMRNGDNLYRICTNLQVGSVLFPTRDEFDEIVNPKFDFYGKPINEPPRPGTARYESLMKEADARRRHYMRILLFLQGLFDRTPVWKPMLTPSVNITNRRESEEVLRFVCDSEMALSDGRPSFQAWMLDLNERLDIGSRIVGYFNSRYFITSSGKNYHSSDVRVSPQHTRPDDYEIYALEERAGEGGYRFRFDRGDVWRRLSYWDRQKGKKSHGPALRRASAIVYSSDDFIINFDDLNPDDIDYYLNSRTNRHEYVRMFPLLMRVRDMKRKEIEQEKPFMELIAGQIASRYGVTLARAMAEVPKLVRWWKFKTKITRALNSDDEKSFSMIVDQFGLLQRRELEMNPKHAEWILSHLAHPDSRIIFIAHKEKNLYISFTPANSGNVFVHQETWRVSSGAIEMIERQEWVLTGSRCDNWRCIYKTQRWDEWERKAILAENLRDSEVEEVVQKGLELYRENIKSHDERRYLPLAITFHDRNRMAIWAHEEPIKSDDSMLLYDKPDCGHIQEVILNWKREKNGFHVCNTRENHHSWDTSGNPDDFNGKSGWPWNNQYHRYPVFKLFPENIEKLKKEFDEYTRLDNKYDDQMSKVRAAANHICQLYNDREKQRAYDEFVAENDPALWDFERQHEKIPRFEYGDKLVDLFKGLMYHGIDFKNKTLGYCFDQAKGKKSPKYKGRNYWHDYELDSVSLPQEKDIPQSVDREWMVAPECELAKTAD